MSNEEQDETRADVLYARSSLVCLSRYPINHNLSDDVLTQTWFIVMLGSIIAIMVFSLGAMVLFKRIQFIKQTSLATMHHHHHNPHHGKYRRRLFVGIITVIITVWHNRIIYDWLPRHLNLYWILDILPTRSMSEY